MNRFAISARKNLSFLKMFVFVRDYHLCKKLAQIKFSPRKWNYNRKSKTVTVFDLEIDLTTERFFFFLKAIHLVRKLNENINGKFFIDNDNNLIFEYQKLKVMIQTEEEIFILKEIFVEGIYNFFFTDSAIILDIGMNVGFASLFFTLRKDDVLVIGFEPFKRTYEQAWINFRLNPVLSKKIRTYNIGLAGTDRIENVEYAQEFRGSIGIYGIPKRFREGLRTSKEQIVLRDVSKIIQGIISEYPTKPIIAKIDCEGAEYEIIDSLYISGKLTNITSFMIEWHYSGPDYLIERLQKSGFMVLSLSPNSKGTGMIYAVNRGN